MEEITFSVFNHGLAASEKLQVLLEQFEKQSGIGVRLEIISNWTLGWSKLVENALTTVDRIYLKWVIPGSEIWPAWRPCILSGRRK